jgi:hypothetical protein
MFSYHSKSNVLSHVFFPHVVDGCRWNPRHHEWYKHWQEATTISQQWNIMLHIGQGWTFRTNGYIVLYLGCMMGLGAITMGPLPTLYLLK